MSGLTFSAPAREAADTGLLPCSLLLPAAENVLLLFVSFSSFAAGEPDLVAAALELLALPGKVGRPAAVAASPAALLPLQERQKRRNKIPNVVLEYVMLPIART